MAPRYPFVSVDAPVERSDELAALLCDLGASGVELRDEGTLSRGPGPGRALLVGSFDNVEAAETARVELARLGLSAELGEIVGDEWRDRYKDYFRPFALTPSLTIAPPWVEHAPKAGELTLSLDPGRAFGTGLHATTALVAEELERRRAEYAGRAVLDVGTGSGILALTAVLFGASSARAVDNDPDVIEVARENAERNGLSAQVQIDTTPIEVLKERYVMVVANLEARTLLRLMDELAERVEIGGLLVISGVLASERDEVLAVYEQRFAHVSTTERGDGDDAWVAMVLRR